MTTFLAIRQCTFKKGAVFLILRIRMFLDRLDSDPDPDQ
jgi:hypothetical protein